MGDITSTHQYLVLIQKQEKRYVSASLRLSRVIVVSVSMG